MHLATSAPLTTNSGAIELSANLSKSNMTAIVHVFICSRIDYCNSHLIGLPKIRLSSIQSVLNAALLLKDLLLTFINSLTSPPSCLTNYTGFHSQLVSSSNWHCSEISRSSFSATSHRPLLSLDWQAPFVPWVKITIAQTWTLRHHWALHLERLPWSPFIVSFNLAVVILLSSQNLFIRFSHGERYWWVSTLSDTL